MIFAWNVLSVVHNGCDELYVWFMEVFSFLFIITIALCHDQGNSSPEQKDVYVLT